MQDNPNFLILSVFLRPVFAPFATVQPRKKIAQRLQCSNIPDIQDLRNRKRNYPRI